MSSGLGHMEREPTPSMIHIPDQDLIVVETEEKGKSTCGTGCTDADC